MIYVAYVHDMYEAFNPALHCDRANAGYSYKSRHVPGQVKEITIERKQLGWLVLDPATPRNVIVSETLTGDIADAYVIARGRIVGIPSDIMARTQSVNIACGPENLLEVADADAEAGTVDGPVMAYCRANFSDGPETCFLLSDTDKDTIESYLVGRSVEIYVDPATHAISHSDFVTGEAFSDMGATHFHDANGVPAQDWEDGYPVPRARMKLVAGWTQSGGGTCDIANHITTLHSDFQGGLGGTHYHVSSLNPDFIAQADSGFPRRMSSSMIRGGGWELDESQSNVEFFGGATRWLQTNRLHALTYNRWLGPQVLGQITKKHPERWRFAVGHYRFRNVPMAYTYEQDREDAVYIVLDQDIQSVPANETELDLGAFTTVDLTLDPTSTPYEPGWKQVGDRVQWGDKVYVCNEAHYSFRMTDQKQGSYGLQDMPLGTTWGGKTWHPFWDEVPSQAPMLRGLSECMTRESGEAIIAHCVMRLRRELLLRNRSMNLTLTWPWALARHLTLKHSIRVVVRGKDREPRPMVGKVKEISDAFGGEAGGTVSVTIGISFGTGAADTTGETIHGPYNTDGYYPAGYLADESPVRGHNDVEWLVQADPVKNHVDVKYLSDPAYSVHRTALKNESGEQFNRMFGVARDPREVVKNNPTRMEVFMRDLTAQDTLTRDIYVAAQLLTSPRGLDLTNGAEP